MLKLHRETLSQLTNLGQNGGRVAVSRDRTLQGSEASSDRVSQNRCTPQQRSLSINTSGTSVSSSYTAPQCPQKHSSSLSATLEIQRSQLVSCVVCMFPLLRWGGESCSNRPRLSNYICSLHIYKNSSYTHDSNIWYAGQVKHNSKHKHTDITQ